MKELLLTKGDHTIKKGSKCPQKTPNVREDVLFCDAETGKPIGFYMRKMPAKMRKLATLADFELRSERVPKQNMDRKRPVGVDANGKRVYEVVTQYSTIIGSVPKKPHMRREYHTKSSVHGHATANNFVKAMLMLANESEKLIKDVMPGQYAAQVKALEPVPQKWKFGKLFTSSISNYNISAPYHQDHANILNTCNVIITKRRNSKGGNLHIPDYNATIDQCDDSILVYPAWRNMHGVTPIEELHPGGYRNSLVFYALKAFTS